MTGRLSRELARWHRKGMRDGAAAGARRAARTASGILLTAQARRRPRTVAESDVVEALGGHDPVDRLSGAVLDALPTVAAFLRELDDLDGGAREAFLDRAEAVLAHRFDLLGSGPTNLGREIDWRADLKTGRRWPLRHPRALRLVYPDASDIKVPWELSRSQHLPLLAGAHRLTADRRFLDEIGAQLEHWIDENPVGLGPNWACTMDVAIRAANWVAALAVCGREAHGEAWLPQTLGSLLLHGRFIRTHLEYGEVRGNHYLADVVGLLPVAALFERGREGRAWADWAAGQLVEEMRHQVRTDGCSHEASIPYHRLVTELFVCGTQAADALLPGAMPAWYRERLAAMLRFVADYSRPDGLAPQIGDADDGRFLPLGDYGANDVRSHLHLFRQADLAYEPRSSCAAYPDGGYYVLRSRDLYVIVRCGDTGMDGRGGHSHNDQLSFELCVRRQPIVIDPGSFVYTADPAARDLFRSTAFHSTLRLDGAEQNELPAGALFSMPDRTRARATLWEGDAASPRFEGEHGGFLALDPPAVHRRRVQVSADGRTVRLRDVVESAGTHSLEWTFPLAPCEVSVDGASARAAFDDATLIVSAEGVELSLEPGWFSPRYGVRLPTPFLRARRRSEPGTDTTEFVLSVE